MALGTSALHSLLLVWISYLLPGPPPLPPARRLLHSSSVQAIKAEGGESPNGIFSDEQNPQARSGRGPGCWGCPSFFLCTGQLTEPGVGGGDHSLYEVGHWML